MLQLCAGFTRRGHSVDLVVAIPGGPLEKRIPEGIRVVDLKQKRSIAALPALAGYLRRERPSAILSTLEHSNILSVWATALARTSTRTVLREASVLLPRDQFKGARPHVQRALMKQVYPRASAIVAVSKSVEEDLVRGLGIAPSQIQTIYNPVVELDLEQRASEPVDDPWFSPGAPPVVMAAGRLSPEKDFANLVRAFGHARKKRTARLVIFGEGKERQRLEALVHELGLEADVRLPGYEMNVYRYMKRAAVFVLSSIFEGLPGSLIQAMACGARVVSTDCPGGSREVLETAASKTSGLLVPVKDSVALGEAIVALLDDHAKGPDRVAHGIDRFREEASLDAYLAVLGVPGAS